MQPERCSIPDNQPQETKKMSRKNPTILIAALVGGLAFTSPSWGAERSQQAAAGSKGLHSAPLTKSPDRQQILPSLQSGTVDKRTAAEKRQPTKSVVSRGARAGALRQAGRRNAGIPNVALLTQRACASQNRAAGRQDGRTGKYVSTCEDGAVKRKPVQIIVPR